MASVDVQPQEDRAVTQDDLRTLRRWVVVAGVWAVAATAVALIALLDDSGRAAERKATQASARVGASEERLDARIDRLNGAIGRVDARLRQRPTTAQVTQLRSQLGSLQRRVAELETAQDAGPQDDTGSGDSGSGSGDDSPGGVLRDLFP